jgi:hypothetical protein
MYMLLTSKIKINLRAAFTQEKSCLKNDISKTLSLFTEANNLKQM